jgi:hypothetical protein
VNFPPIRDALAKAEQVTEPDLSPEFSDDALALEFTQRHKHELRYVAKWGAWLFGTERDGNLRTR